MKGMAKKKPRYLQIPREWIDAEVEFLRENPDAVILAGSPPGYHDFMDAQAKAAKAAAVRSSKRKASKRSSR